jgi:hypothetical protein
MQDTGEFVNDSEGSSEVVLAEYKYQLEEGLLVVL